jgi:hypothetical protein
MATLEIVSFVITMSIGGVTLIRIINDSRKHLCSIVINILLGGFFFALINIIGFKINLNLITGSIITFLGVPGIALIVILKLMFGIF